MNIPNTELVFNAKMISDMSQDKDRVFALNFDRQSKQISITEGKSRTSPAGGRFLAKQLINNPKTNQPYSEANLYIGARITAAGRNFELVDAPEFTLSYMEAFPNKFLYTDIDQCLEAIEKVGPDVRTKFEEIDPTGFGTIPADKAKDCLMSFTPQLPKQAAVTLLRRFTKGDRFQYTHILEGANL